ncbi:hormone-sensitive lipase [Blumeria hordei DH14]|uniref:Hormone-sensitive lipase n=1 Tax=Blumeria graminis f. sp. hordei (strain DH14) TaxID=546991 RepID=N1J5A7_BLUG1|nr:hormone-sensitive lipase [Blumeria hordei DH14]
MIDHVLGRPSVKFRKIQVLAVVSFWSFYLFKGPRHGPPTIRKFSRRLSKILTPWQILVLTLLYLYTARNFGRLIGLECPEPLANLYTPSYFRATWVTTAMDAGFWTAMRIRRKWLRDLASFVFTLYYLAAAEQADEKVRKVRGALTVEHLRVSWNKGTTPYISFFNKLMRPRFMRYPPRQLRIPRPTNSDYKDPVGAWLFFDGPLSELKNHTKVVIDIPGGGFIAMNPRHNDDKLLAWAGKTGLPVLSLDYKKAPEHPYPYALNECFDVYRTIVATRGRCLGLAGSSVPQIILTGDSAGGNLATGLTLMAIHARQNGADLPIPDGLILIYPGLDMNIGNWMSDEQMALIKDRRFRRTNREIIRRKKMQYTLTAGTPHHSDDEDAASPPPRSLSPEPIENYNDISLPSPQFSKVPTPFPFPNLSRPSTANSQAANGNLSHHPSPMKTRLAMSSMLAYFNDRILSPEMMRAMMILYIGPHNRPDFASDYLLSPMLAPDSLLVDFPKTYIMTGERDPLVDDTVIFAGRLRRARAMKHAEELKHGHATDTEWDDNDIVEVHLMPGISHGFLQFPGCFPDGWKYINRIGKWIEVIFDQQQSAVNFSSMNRRWDGHRSRAESSGDDTFLEMNMTRKDGTTWGFRKEEKERLLYEIGAGLRTGSRGRRRKQGMHSRKKSMVSLASEDDLLGRRMLGVAGTLTRVGRHES